jgi:hypothetical protein
MTNEAPTKYERFVDCVTKALAELKAEVTPVMGAAIRNWAEKNSPDEFVDLQASWNTYLTTASNDAHTRIRRVPGKYTWTLEPTRVPRIENAQGASTEETASPETVANLAQPQVGGDVPGLAPPAEQAAYVKRETTLYPSLRDWLAGNRYGAEDTSKARGGRKWGNPDVTGIRITEGPLGSKELEITTIEAKIKKDDWRQLIFEAVSHKRFAHRAYFAFAFGSDEPLLEAVDEREELRMYAERFRIGVLVVFMPSETFKRLQEGGTPVELGDDDDVVVEELWPAVHDEVRMDEVTRFLRDTLGLASDREVYAFGQR